MLTTKVPSGCCCLFVFYLFFLNYPWKQRPAGIAMLELEVHGGQFLRRHRTLGNSYPCVCRWWSGEPWKLAEWKQSGWDGGCGCWWSHSPPQQDPFTPPPTKARGPRYWHMPLSPWTLQRKKIRSESQNPVPRENRLSKSWYYWCWWKLRGACNLFNKSRAVFAGAPEFSCFLANILRG